MIEIVVEDGSWTVDVEAVRITPGSGRDVHEVRKVRRLRRRAGVPAVGSDRRRVEAAVGPGLREPAFPRARRGPDGRDLLSRDLLIRRLADLGELHRSGVLTDEEFSTAKKALLDRIAEL
ncbi:SHOCT domain-containing protein [Microbispora sp. CA-102843]|uniref:SHOCT domain-containing protein n=1 Tax=Microbispora sp. CA-102843 TaxID=3239952 RepID=UPI003D91AA7A